MRSESEVAILAPRVVQDAVLPARWKRHGRFDDLPELAKSDLLARVFRLRDISLPAAPLHYLAMTGTDPAGYCFYAHPVYLHARREQLILMTGPEYEPDDREAAILIALLQNHFPEWRIERTRDAMWFMIVEDDPSLETTPLQNVLGENINEHLPRGRDAMEWINALNEVQMVLFDAEVNQEREAEGRPPVNSLWFWGGGRLPDVDVTRWKCLVTDDPVALGIGRQAGIETCWMDDQEAESALQPDIAKDGCLWVYQGSDLPGPGRGALSVEHWSRLRGALKRGEIDRLILIEPGYGELSIDVHDTRSWLWWR